MKPSPTNSTAPSIRIACGLVLAFAAPPVGTRAADWKNNGPSSDWNGGVVPNNAGAFIPLNGHTQEHAANNL
jgi:hypothetical protein